MADALPTSLRERQIHALHQMLNLNQPLTKMKNAEPTWKILIYDQFGQDIISPLLPVKELRELGVTLHLQLHSERDPIPDVPAVYFCQPSEDNLSRICADLDAGLYDNYHFNFITPIFRHKLEDLASAALQAGCVTQVNKVYDQYLGFISLEDDMFFLRHQNSEDMSYYAINRAEVRDTEMEAIMDVIVDSLFSVFATLGVVPIIRSPRGNAAEMVAEKLDKKLRENLRDSRNCLFSGEPGHGGHYSFQRPLLIVLDRNLDMTTPLHHTWIYQALAHDVLDLRLNRVTVKEEVTSENVETGAKPRTKYKTSDLDHSDKFWRQYKGSPFPTVAEAIQEELEKYRSSEEDVKKIKESMGLSNDADAAVGMLTDNTAKLTSAVSSLPVLMEQKRLIDMHMNVATGILNSIKSRKLDTYFELEEKIMSKGVLEKPLSDILSDPEMGTPQDKMRLFLIYYLCGQSTSTEDMSQYISILEECGCDLSPYKYIKRWKDFSKLVVPQTQYSGGGTKTGVMFSKLMSQGSSFVMGGVKNLVVKRHNLPVTRIVDNLMDARTSQESEEYRYFDPKLLRITDPSQIPRSKVPFQEVLVFIVGGGNYIEYQNLQDYVTNKSGSSRRIVYGSTSLQNADQFMEELKKLGEEHQ